MTIRERRTADEHGNPTCIITGPHRSLDLVHDGHNVLSVVSPRGLESDIYPAPIDEWREVARQIVTPLEVTKGHAHVMPSLTGYTAEVCYPDEPDPPDRELRDWGLSPELTALWAMRELGVGHVTMYDRDGKIVGRWSE